MNQTAKNILTRLTPILGAGAVGACPLCWIGSASLLTYLGLGVLIPVWQWIVSVFLALALVGFVLDYRSHKNFYPLVLLVIGGAILLYGRYGPLGGEGFTGWQVWGPGAILVLAAVIYNKRQFSKKSHEHHEKI
ncbi:MAG: MerC domain-containing protein [Candidatus Roizmanbacteria bacterium]|nr:MerC domain-containing protein [Candidatus Roizmanbacteria bacterium]